MIELVLVTDADFEAFCLDYFPEVSKRFASSNDRLQKANLLLGLVEPQLILARLREAHGDAVREHEGGLEYSRGLGGIKRRGAVWLIVAVLIFVAVGGLVGGWRRGTQTGTAKLASDGGVTGVSRTLPAAMDAAVADLGTTSSAVPLELPVLKIFNEKQRKDATKLSAPVASIEKFFQNTRDLGEHAELVTYKKIDAVKRQWITQVVLVDGRNHRPVSMIIYSEAEFRSWVSDLSTVGTAIRQALVNIEKILDEIASYKVSAEEVLQQRTSKKMEDAIYAMRFEAYDEAIRIGWAIGKDPSETATNRAKAFHLVALSACSRKRWDVAGDAIRELGRLNRNMQQHAASVCRDRGMR